MEETTLVTELMELVARAVIQDTLGLPVQHVSRSYHDLLVGNEKEVHNLIRRNYFIECDH